MILYDHQLLTNNTKPVYIKLPWILSQSDINADKGESLDCGDNTVDIHSLAVPVFGGRRLDWTG